MSEGGEVENEEVTETVEEAVEKQIAEDNESGEKEEVVEEPCVEVKLEKGSWELKI